jgi:hypothetical protein
MTVIANGTSNELDIEASLPVEVVWMTGERADLVFAFWGDRFLGGLIGRLSIGLRTIAARNCE